MTMLNDFRPPVAVVDWVAIVVEFKRKSHGGHLKGAYDHLGVSHAAPLDKGGGSAASMFEIRVQHPSNYAVIEKLISDLDTKYGFITPPKLRALEVSIDFYHKCADLSALQAMTERLMFSVVPNVINNPRMHDLSGGFYPRKSEINATKTLYIGNNRDDAMWRVYWKRTDESFVGEEGSREVKGLPDSEFRARVEVQLQGDALKRLHLDSVTDLGSFSYERLHSDGLFKFAHRDRTSGAIFTNPYSMCAGASFGVDDDAPAYMLNGFGRSDRRGRTRLLSRHLSTDTELTEATRLALRRLSKRFAESLSIV